MTDYRQIKYPERIVCLTEETTEALYLMGEQDRIVGISGYTVRPAHARKEKPKVSGFINAKIDKITDLKPDLVLAFSDMQADIVKDLIKQGISVHCFNQRSISEIFQMIATLGALIGRPDKSAKLIADLAAGVEEIKQKAALLTERPKVYFEEWNDPIITGIGWISELIQIAGGNDCYPEFAKESLAKNRIVANNQDVVARQPDIIIGSWCGKRFVPEKVKARENWQTISAVQNNELHEIKSADILQPGPACLTDGLQQIYQIIENWHQKQSN
ncbi:cobalamin-binding protein [Catenovulum sp. SM1970]|uniref:cobalamin-binding protein n=1 Tax=Marinifaba aquimaris TaxID=2741323 RepID=UPI0015744F4E|nr:cobalamin-binding protein [Marinifaba aquimaris]NTS75561.1 cobalamin-binding protein [Marinifaba aquimaris]